MRRPNGGTILKLLAVVLVLVAVWAFWPTHTVVAIGNPDTFNARFPMIGISAGRTARLNISSMGNPDIIPPGPCRFRLSFHDSTGAVITGGEAGAPVSTEVTLMPGQSAFLDLPAANAGLGSALRKQIRGSVRAVIDASVFGACARARAGASLELFENATGHTVVAYGNPDELPPNPVDDAVTR